MKNTRHKKLSLRSIASFLPVSFNSFGRGMEAILRKLSLMEAKVSAVDKSRKASFYEKWTYENNILMSAEAQANRESDNITVHV